MVDGIRLVCMNFGVRLVAEIYNGQISLFNLFLCLFSNAVGAYGCLAILWMLMGVRVCLHVLCVILVLVSSTIISNEINIFKTMEKLRCKFCMINED